MQILLRRKSISKENTDSQGLASASDVEKLTQRIPDLRNQIREAEECSHNIISTLKESWPKLEAASDNSNKIRDRILDALRKENDWIDKERFKDAESREAYIASVTNAIAKVKYLPDLSSSNKSVLNELGLALTRLASTISETRGSLAEIEDLLPRHESYELGMWYEEARKRTKLRPLYIGFFSILVIFIAFIVLSMTLWQGETGGYAWYTAIGQYAGLRFALLGAFTGVLWFLGKQISNQKRISEEYGHKETMMKSFRGFASKLSSMREAVTKSTAAVEAQRQEIIFNILKTESDLASAAINVLKKNPAENLSTRIFTKKTRSTVQES